MSITWNTFSTYSWPRICQRIQTPEMLYTRLSVSVLLDCRQEGVDHVGAVDQLNALVVHEGVDFGQVQQRRNEMAVMVGWCTEPPTL